MASVLEKNKDTVRRFLQQGIAGTNHGPVLAETATEAITIHFPAPTSLKGEGSEGGDGTLRGRGLLLQMIEDSHDGGIYEADTTQIEILHMVAEGDLVAVRFVLRATTTLRKESYENHYHHLFRLRDGKVDEIWEYIDTLYSSRKLWDSIQKKPVT